MSTNNRADQLRSLFAALHGLSDPDDVDLRIVPASSPGAILSCHPTATGVVAAGAPGEALAALEATVRDLALARLERLAGVLGYALVETPEGPAIAPVKPQAGAAGPGLTREAHDALAARVDRALRELEPYDLVGWRPGSRGVVVLPGPGVRDREAFAASLCEQAGLRLERADVDGRRAWLVVEIGSSTATELANLISQNGGTS